MSLEAEGGTKLLLPCILSMSYEQAKIKSEHIFWVCLFIYFKKKYWIEIYPEQCDWEVCEASDTVGVQIHCTSPKPKIPPLLQLNPANWQLFLFLCHIISSRLFFHYSSFLPFLIFLFKNTSLSPHIDVLSFFFHPELSDMAMRTGTQRVLRQTWGLQLQILFPVRHCLSSFHYSCSTVHSEPPRPFHNRPLHAAL